jgi:hypothetical protein
MRSHLIFLLALATLRILLWLHLLMLELWKELRRESVLNLYEENQELPDHLYMHELWSLTHEQYRIHHLKLLPLVPNNLLYKMH